MFKLPTAHRCRTERAQGHRAVSLEFFSGWRTYTHWTLDRTTLYYWENKDVSEENFRGMSVAQQKASAPDMDLDTGDFSSGEQGALEVKLSTGVILFAAFATTTGLAGALFKYYAARNRRHATNAATAVSGDASVGGACHSPGAFVALSGRAISEESERNDVPDSANAGSTSVTRRLFTQDGQLCALYQKLIGRDVEEATKYKSTVGAKKGKSDANGKVSSSAERTSYHYKTKFVVDRVEPIRGGPLTLEDLNGNGDFFIDEESCTECFLDICTTSSRAPSNASNVNSGRTTLNHVVVERGILHGATLSVIGTVADERRLVSSEELPLLISVDKSLTEMVEGLRFRAHVQNIASTGLLSVVGLVTGITAVMLATGKIRTY